MATTTKAKAPKTTTTPAPKIKVQAVDSISEHYALISSGSKELELGFIVETAQKMADSGITVAQVKASIAQAIEASGNAPTLRPSHAQHFITCSLIISKHAEAEEMSVGDLIKLAVRFNTKNGSGSASDLIEATDSLEAVEALSPAISPKSKKGTGELKKESKRDVDSILAVTLAALQGFKSEQLKAVDTANLEKISQLLAIIVKNSVPLKKK
jgi:hypothetical protein